MNKKINLISVTKEELLELPLVSDINKRYESIIVVPGDTIHESGFNTITVIGLSKDKTADLITKDAVDILWFTMTPTGLQKVSAFQVDMLPNAKCTRIYSSLYDFNLNAKCSIVDVHLVPKVYDLTNKVNKDEKAE